MFIGHAALALAARPRTPRLSLPVLLAATYLLDLLWPLFLLLGIEHVRIVPGITAFSPLAFDSYPWSHSLLMAIVWGAIAGDLIRRATGRHSDGLVVSALVVSHWFLDLIVHRADLPLWPGHSPLVGLGLWNSIPATLVVEGALFVAGAALYMRGTRARDVIGSVALYGLLLFLVLAWVSGLFSPPPPSASAIAWVGLAGGLLILAWSWWVGRHRELRQGGGTLASSSP